jgi:hypothetical protein
METISGSIAISYNPGKEIYTLRFDPASGDANKSRHNACQPDGRSCGRVRLNLPEALQFLQKAGSADPTALLAKTRVSGGASIKANITRHQHGSLLGA